jgi:hypothetical protein
MISCDAIENTTTLNGCTYTWKVGRQLAKSKRVKGTTISYKYNESVRISKTKGITTNYTLLVIKL